MGFKVAVVGATGNVGREMLNILAERRFPADEVVALASRKSMGVEVSYGDKILKCKALEQFDFSDVDICLMSAGGAVSKEWSPKIGAQGAVVIDNSSQWRQDPDVPLIVPEVNAGGHRRLPQEEHHRQPELLDRAARRGAEAPARQGQDHARRGVDLSIGVRRRQGRHGRARPPDQGDLLAAGRGDQEVSQAHRLQRHPAHRRVHGGRLHQGRVEDGGRDQEILDPKIKLSATCVRVPVFIGHSEAVNIEFENPISVEEARQILRNAPGCTVIDKHEPGGYVTPLECVGEDETYISRIRTDPTVDNGLVLWCVSDNLRKGAALNAIQIAELLINRKLIKAKQKAA